MDADDSYDPDRDDGTVLVTGMDLKKPEETPWGFPVAMAIGPEGGLDHYMATWMGGGRCTLIPGSDQYADAIRIYNYDGSIDYGSYRWLPTGISGSTEWPGVVFEGRRVLKAGYFRFSADYSETVAIMCDSVGELDTTTFIPRPVTGNDPSGWGIRQLRNGQYLMNGRWLYYDGHLAGSLVRLWPDGSIDTSFYFPPAVGVVDGMLEQEDGKLILGGRFYYGNDTLNLIRLKLDGSMDSTFNNHNVFARGVPYGKGFTMLPVIYPLEDGRIILGGYFNSINGEERNGLACVDSTGNLLGCWAGGGLGLYCVKTYDDHPTWRYLVGGGLRGIKCLENGDCYMFGAYKGVTDDRGHHPDQVMISRIVFTTSGMGERQPPTPALKLWPNPAPKELNLSWAVPGSFLVELHDLQGRMMLQRSHHSGGPLDVTKMAPGLYTVTAIGQGGQRATAKWIKE